MQLASLLLATTMLAVPLSISAYASAADIADSNSTFSITSKTQVPGLTLKPGDYAIRIVDHLTDRVIVRVDSATGKEHALFLGVPSSSLGRSSSPGVVNWSSDLNGTPAIRGFAFSNGSAVEFVYPKAEAAALAQVNTSRVIAVDPESEGRPSALKNLSKDDMQMVNLWMLSLTTAAPNSKPALLAQKYKSDEPTPAAPAPTVAATAPAAASPAPPTQVARLEKPQVSEPRQPRAAAAAAPKPHPVVAKLPHTASDLPVIYLLGFVSLGSAAGLRFARRSRSARAIV